MIGIMENPDANQLPEVDSLPDGFVESSLEPLAPATPTLEQEEPLGSYEEGNAAEFDCSNESRPESSSANECQKSQGRTEKTQKLRTFPVVLSESDNFDASVESLREDCVEHTEGSHVTPDSAESTSVASVGLSECGGVKEQLREKCQSSDRRSYLFLAMSHILLSN